MSREERRAYQRQMKNMERGPALPPSARQRAERKAARRADRRGPQQSQAAFDTRFWIRSAAIAAVIGVIGFSLQWREGMPWALYVGLAVAVMALTILVGVRLLQRRAAALGSTDRAQR
jgi:hypothetical protein